MLNRSATANLFAEYKVKSYTIAAGAGNAGVAQTADTDLINGKVIGVYYNTPTNDADAYIMQASLAASTGVVTVRLSGNTTAEVVVDVVVALASGNIA